MKARLIIILNNPNTAALIFQGVGGNALPYYISSTSEVKTMTINIIDKF